MQRTGNHDMSKKFCTGKKIQDRKPRDVEGVG